MKRAVPVALVLLVTSGAVAAPAPPAKKTPPRPAAPAPKLAKGKDAKGARWVAATPDEMVQLAGAHAKEADPSESLAGMAILAQLSDRAAPGASKQKLDLVSDRGGPLGDQARWVAAALEPATSRAAPPGLVTSLAVLGPFQDTSGRVKERDIAENDPAAWASRDGGWSWGVYEVKWRPIVTPVTARGVPLELYIHPRKESCSYVASRITVKDAGPIVVHVASSGAVRLVWDGVDLGVSEEIHEGAMFDRLGAEVDATAGDHLVAARVCSGAPEDQGRVRLRLSKPDGAAAAFTASRDFQPLVGKTFGAKLKVTPVVEPLTRALEPAKHPTASQALAAAIVRARGGADDLRSPRAPGLLESVAKEAGLDANRLAMAGWVSPFGAVRSGWLNAARDRAVAEGDGATADFTARRIAAARAESGFAEWALAALSAAPVSDDKDPEAIMLRAHVRGEVGGEPTKRAGLTELVALADALGPKAPASVWDQIARVSRSFDPKLEWRARTELARLVPERSDLERVRASFAIDGDAVTAAVRAAVEDGGVTDGSELDDLGQLLVQAGRDQGARDFLSFAAGVAPNVAAIQRGLAEALYATRDAKDKERGDRVLARAHDLEPADARLSAELALRSGGGKRRELPDERWLVAPEALLAKARANPAKKGEVGDRQAYWLRAVTQHDDKRISQMIHYGREIVIQPRTQEELYEQIPAEGDETEILRARVHRPSGEIVFAEEQKSDGGRPMIRWPDLRPGDIVEVAIRSWTSGPIGRRGDHPFYFLDYGGAVSTHPLLYNEVVLDLPKERPLAVDVLNGKPDRVERKEEGSRTITHYIWDSPVIVPDEPLAPRMSEVLPTLVVSSFATWDDFRTWYNGAVAGFTEPDDQVRKLAAELTKGKKTRDEKLRALFEFVADDIRYVNYVSGEWWLPNRPQQLLARRQGDCDDKALLLITLLKSVGIDATEVLIQTRYTGQPGLLLSKKAAIPLFDHGIAYLPAKDGRPEIWLDATSPQSRLGPVPSMDTRTFALFATEGPAEMRPTPRGTPEDYGSDATWNLVLAADGSVKMDAEERHRGDHAFYLRTQLREKDARAQWVEQNLVAGWIPQVEVDKDVAFEGDLARGEATVKFKARSGALGRLEGDDLVVTLAPSSTLTSSYAPLPKRTLPVALPPNLAPSKQSHVVRLVAPEGMKPGDLPPGGDEQGGEFGRARLEVTVDPKDPRVVRLVRSVTYDLETIPVAKYEAWRAWLGRVDSLLHRSVRFVPDGKAVKGGAK